MIREAIQAAPRMSSLQVQILWSFALLCAALPAAVATCTLAAQDLPLTHTVGPSAIAMLDPARSVQTPVLERNVHKPLPEEYVWTASERSDG